MNLAHSSASDPIDQSSQTLPEQQKLKCLMPHSILKDSSSKQLESRRSRRLTDGNGNLSSTNISTCTRVSFDQPTIPTGSFGPSTFNRLAAIEDNNLQKTSNLRQRRTSLPVSSNAFVVSKAALQNNLVEARGLVAEMLANKDLPPTVISGLKAVATLLNPQPPSINLHFDFGLPMVVENPYSGEQLVVAAHKLSTEMNKSFS
ncbi:hypothetical protein ACH3XW_21155 [Acanthocheilonema viteae]